MLQLFYSAKVILGAHGAAFVNTIFCNQDARIFEFNARNRPHLGLKDKTRLTSHYEQIELDADLNHDITISVKLLRSLI